MGDSNNSLILRALAALVIVYLQSVAGVANASDKSSFNLQWQGKDFEQVRIFSAVDAKVTKECLAAGLELEHRFIFKLCERLNRFGLVCSDQRKEIHRISYDPIQDGYRVVKDRLGDDEDPIGATFSIFQEAMDNLAVIDYLPISFVEQAGGHSFSKAREEQRLGIRIRTRCKGEVSRVFAELSYFFSFGLVDLYGHDTGWRYYRLHKQELGQE